MYLERATGQLEEQKKWAERDWKWTPNTLADQADAIKLWEF